MRYLLLLGTTLCLFACSNLKYLEPFSGYHGKPKKLDWTMLTPGRGADSGKEIASGTTSYLFDTKGRVVKEQTYRADGTPTHRTAYVYDRKGNTIEIAIFGADNKLNVRNLFKYNKYGQQVERKYFLGTQQSMTTTTYDRERRVATIIGYTNDTIFKEHSILKYDRNWKVLQLKSYDKNGGLSTRIEMQYDGKGNEMLSQWFDSTNKMYDVYKSYYDNRNNRIKIETRRLYKDSWTPWRITEIKYEYDDKGNIVYEALKANGVTTSIHRNKFTY